MAASVLSLRGAKAAISSRVLFENLDLEVRDFERVCLIGRNGAGKSTLLKILAGTTEPDAGERALGPKVLAAYLPQEPEVAAHGTLRERVLDGVPPARRDEEWGFIADQLLGELGLEPDRGAQGLSGGEKRRVSLARLLLPSPELLLLDEPTNHLDLPTIEWLENRLKNWNGSLVTVSHDRRFLAAVSNRMWWLDRGRLLTRDEGYEGFEAWSEELDEAEAKELDRLRQHLKAEERWLQRGVTARRRRNQGRLRKLGELRAQKREHLHKAGGPKIDARTAKGGGSVVVEGENLSKRFGGKTVLDRFSLRLIKGERLGVIGANGAGKTTLVKLLLGEEEPDEGWIKRGTGLEVARFEQDRGSLESSATPWSTLCPDGGDQVVFEGGSRHVAGYLKDFLFRDDQLRTPVGALSGGERNRLLLARILAKPSNLLVLDEPTNDLDLETLDVLEETLAGYNGTLILVSHDRDFLDRTVTSTILIEPGGRATEYAGGFSDTIAQRSAEEDAAALKTKAGKPQSLSSPNKNDHEQRKETQRRLRELERLPAKIEAAGVKIAALEAELSDPIIHQRHPDKAEAKNAQLEQARREQADLEERWLELEEFKEGLAANVN